MQMINKVTSKGLRTLVLGSVALQRSSSLPGFSLLFRFKVVGVTVIFGLRFLITLIFKVKTLLLSPPSSCSMKLICGNIGHELTYALIQDCRLLI